MAVKQAAMEKVSRTFFTASGPQCCVSLGEGPDLRVISEGAVGPSPASARQEVLVTTLLKVPQHFVLPNAKNHASRIYKMRERSVK